MVSTSIDTYIWLKKLKFKSKILDLRSNIINVIRLENLWVNCRTCPVYDVTSRDNLDRHEMEPDIYGRFLPNLIHPQNFAYL